MLYDNIFNSINNNNIPSSNNEKNNFNQSYINQNPQTFISNNKNYFAESNTYIKIMSNDIKNENVFNNNEIIYLLKYILNKVIK